MILIWRPNLRIAKAAFSSTYLETNYKYLAFLIPKSLGLA